MDSEETYIDFDVATAITKIIKGLNDLDRTLEQLTGSWKFCVAGEVKLGWLDGERDMAILQKDSSGRWVAKVVHGVRLNKDDEIV